jgi:hypothetical protein
MFPIQDSVPSRSVPVVTRALILINVIVFFLELSLPQAAVEQFFYLFGIVPARGGVAPRSLTSTVSIGRGSGGLADREGERKWIFFGCFHAFGTSADDQTAAAGSVTEAADRTY